MRIDPVAGIVALAIRRLRAVAAVGVDARPPQGQT
ncbi:hypothetical protein ABIB82_003432 [Bradyrhizobium sp. i1.8.4]